MVICIVLPNILLLCRPCRQQLQLFSKGHATNLAIVRSALVLLAVFGLFTHRCMHTHTFSHNVKLEGWVLYFGPYLLFHLFLVLVLNYCYYSWAFLITSIQFISNISFFFGSGQLCKYMMYWNDLLWLDPIRVYFKSWASWNKIQLIYDTIFFPVMLTGAEPLIVLMLTSKMYRLIYIAWKKYPY